VCDVALNHHGVRQPNQRSDLIATDWIGDRGDIVKYQDSGCWAPLQEADERISSGIVWSMEAGAVVDDDHINASERSQRRPLSAGKPWIPRYVCVEVINCDESYLCSCCSKLASHPCGFLSHTAASRWDGSNKSNGEVGGAHLLLISIFSA